MRRAASLPSALAETLEALRERLPLRFAGTPNWRAPVGCPHCRHTGFKGRLGIYEMVDVTPELQSALMRRLPDHELTALARRQGWRNLREDGLIKAWQGLTSVEEVMRVTGAAEATETAEA